MRLSRTVAGTFALALVAAAVSPAIAQEGALDQLKPLPSRGGPVSPMFDGWYENPDGSYSFTLAFRSFPVPPKETKAAGIDELEREKDLRRKKDAFLDAASHHDRGEGGHAVHATPASSFESDLQEEPHQTALARRRVRCERRHSGFNHFPNTQGHPMSGRFLPQVVTGQSDRAPARPFAPGHRRFHHRLALEQRVGKDQGLVLLPHDDGLRLHVGRLWLLGRGGRSLRPAHLSSDG